MIAVLRHGQRSAPRWLMILMAAEKWGCPPWSITGHDGPFERLRWLHRWMHYQAQRNSAEEDRIDAAVKSRR